MMETDFTPEETLYELRETLRLFDQDDQRTLVSKSARIAVAHELARNILAEIDNEDRPVEQRIELAVGHLQSLRGAYEAYEAQTGERVTRAIRIVNIDVTLETFAGIAPPDDEPKDPAEIDWAPAPG
ncbi:hypothetical protein [Roseivivax sp. CAU 1761]